MTDSFRFVQCGDRALLLYLGDRIDPELNRRVHALARRLRQNRHPALVEVTPSYHCLMIEYDPLRIRPEQLREQIMTAAHQAVEKPEPDLEQEIPVVYGGDMGPDLDDVAAHTGLTPSEVIQRHAGGLYRVYALGFAPGFPYLGGLDPALNVPRLDEPRIRVPAGSVGIGGVQTGIYSQVSPGAWRIIGRTPMPLFDPWQEPPTPLVPGASIRFQPVTREQYEALATAAYTPRPVLPVYSPDQTGIRVLQPGFSTTVQDLGRRGYMGYGVTLAGAADFSSLMIGNWLVGNRARTAGLEITLTGPELEFSGPTAFSITGAPIPAELIPADGGSPRPVPGWTALLAGPGDRLRTGTLTAGCRSYVCVAGGFDLEPVLGSLSEDLFGKIGPFGRPLATGDWLPCGLPLQPPANQAGRTLDPELRPRFEDLLTLRITPGPHVTAFAPGTLETMLASEYTVGAESDRQGLRLQGPALAHSGPADVLSEPLPAGSIQVPGGGQPILLLNNRQTLGGYTRIGTAIYPDVSRAAQLRPGGRIQFQLVDASDAHALAWAARRSLVQIRRELERDFPRGDQPGIRPARVEVRSAAPVAEPAERPAEPAAAAHFTEPEAGPVRTFRITVAGITYQADVEEVAE